MTLSTTTHRRAETLRALEEKISAVPTWMPGASDVLKLSLSLLKDYDARITELERRQDAARSVM